jgi:hypothetical protein
MTIERASRTNVITLEYIPSKINSVNVKKKGAQFFSSTSNYTLSGKTIQLDKIYESITVNYEYDIAQDPEALQNYIAFTEEAFNGDLKNFLIKNSNESLKTQATSAKTKRASVEGTTLGTNVNVTKGGFTSLSASVEESQTETGDTVVSILVDGVPQITVKKSLSSSDQGDITTLTGKTASGALLNATIVTGNPKGIEAALTSVIGATKRQTKAALQNVSPYPNEVSTAVEENVSIDVATTSERIASRTMDLLNNPFKAIDPVSSTKGFGSLGLDFGNILGALLGEQLQVPQIKSFGQEMPSLPKTFVLPDNTTPPPSIILPDASTNIRKNLRETSPLPANAQNSIPPLDLEKPAAEFKYPLPANYEFTTVGGYEELEAELKKAKRDITTAVVRWTLTHTDHNLDAYDIHREHSVALAKLYELQPGDILKIEASSPGTFGIQWHYVIRRDGVIQRGRPIEKKVLTVGDTNLVNHSLHIGFVGGYNGPSSFAAAKQSSDSYTPAQWEAFDAFLTAFYGARPGAQVLGYNDIVPEASGPGFDVELYIGGKYKKTNVISNNVLSTEELNTRPPAETAAPSRINEREEEPLVPTGRTTAPAIAEAIVEGLTNSDGPTEEQLIKASEEYAAKSREADRIFNEAKALQEDARKKYGREIPPEVRAKWRPKFEQVADLEDEMYALRKEMMNNDFRYDEETQSWKEIK